MAGSFTYYHGFTLIAKRDILAGEELFADRHSYYPLLEDSLPKPADYEYADAIVNDLMTLGMSLTDAQWTGTKTNLFVLFCFVSVCFGLVSFLIVLFCFTPKPLFVLSHRCVAT